MQAVQRLAITHRDSEGSGARPLPRRPVSLDRFHLKVDLLARPGEDSTLLGSAAHYPHGRQQRRCRGRREGSASLREQRHGGVVAQDAGRRPVSSFLDEGIGGDGVKQRLPCS